MTLQQLLIANLKKARKERGISQMTLSELCNMSGNYIGHIEMGRRVPSFETVEKIAAALEMPAYELFAGEGGEKQPVKQLKTKDFLIKMPADVKNELVSRLSAMLKKDIAASLNPRNY